MSDVKVWDTEFDVVNVAGPRVHLWPSVGVRALSALCARFGLKVGNFGGDATTALGVLPQGSHGGVVVCQDAQGRIHRIRARAVIKWSTPNVFPPPFLGWNSGAVLPIETAEALLERTDSRFFMQALPGSLAVIILGSGNGALRFGSRLIDLGLKDILIVESKLQWGGKRISGWEVERRRFEVRGGRIVEGHIESVQRPTGSHEGADRQTHHWSVKIKDSMGVRVVDAFKVISAGPFEDEMHFREFPPNSLLYEVKQTAPKNLEDGVEASKIEEERGRYLATRLIRALTTAPLSVSRREELDRVHKLSKLNLKRHSRHFEIPHFSEYDGKWLSQDSKLFLHFEVSEKPLPALECFECISCNLCEVHCPEKAIEISPGTEGAARMKLIVDRCTACGLCVSKCPSEAITLLSDVPKSGTAQIELPNRGGNPGELVTLLNRRGEPLASGKVVGLSEDQKRVKLGVPVHLLWEARGYRRQQKLADEAFVWARSLEAKTGEDGLVSIQLNGERRIARPKQSVLDALFENGIYRPGDVLSCNDGSCGLCTVVVDGTRKAACQEVVHHGMAIDSETRPFPDLLPAKRLEGSSSQDSHLCPCLGINESEAVEKISEGSLRTPEALFQSLQSGGPGRCHGMKCSENFRRLLQTHGVEEARSWIDWRFPWKDWKHWPTGH